jgi:uncharacterized SAM-binding protein YcdF (DUF218 family)
VFFLLSKIGWLLITPSTFLTLALAAGFGLMRWKRLAVFGRRLAISAAIVLGIIILLPVGTSLGRLLEQRFPAWSGCTGVDAPAASGIILLGGGLQSVRVNGHVEEMLNDGADRIRYAATLARSHPGIPVLISGGQVYPRAGMRSEAEGMADMLVELGVARDRIRLEAGSRTTAENATLAKSIAAGSEGPWLLVTSAFHMPRSMGVFRHAGMSVIAAPTDWHGDDDASPLLFNVSGQLGAFDFVVHEYVGLLGYWLGGKTDTLFPGPGAEAACPIVDHPN